MASIASTCRLAVRSAAQGARSHAPKRAFRSSSRPLAAQSFTMPALSPTMTEGNITSWKVKEGDSFSAGDVILEVETDKATMDVEAQDDGILAKIMQPDGSKAIQVGSRIAVLAEPGDDLSSLEMPAEESVSAEPSAAQQSEAKPEQKETSTPSKPTEKPAPTKNPKQKYPLYPSVAVLLHRHKLSADQIKATGPNGRLLKGDVLAHVKEISSSYPQELSSRLDKRSHLDLSNIKPAPPSSSKAGQGAAAQKAAEQAAEPAPTEQPRLLAMPISLASVLSVQRRMQESLGVTLPLSTFISRAVDLANDGLPAREDPPTADELFDAVVGVSTAGGKLSRGHFIPQVAALPSTNGLGLAPRRQASSRRDLFDEIVGSRSGASMAASRSMSSVSGSLGAAGAENLFSLSVDRAEEKRAKLFLERVKAVLEVDPGRLVL